MIVSLAIIFDDPVQPFSHIDNICVAEGEAVCPAPGEPPPTGAFVWTRPADNGAN